MHIHFGLRAFNLVLCASTAVAVLCFPSGATRRSRVQGALFKLAIVLPGLLWALLLCILYAGTLALLAIGFIAGAGAAAGTEGIVFECPAFLACAAEPRAAAKGKISLRWEPMPGSAQAGIRRVRLSTSVDDGSRGERVRRSAALLGVGGLLVLAAYALSRMTWWGLRRGCMRGPAGAGRAR